MKNKFPIKSATHHLPSREIQTINKYFKKPAMVAERSKALSHIQVERMPYVPGSNPALAPRKNNSLNT